ncbi:hypothetical protein MMC28_000320 [Mycoblastus sanguinarius]|nr:hypothetical protein [Mycoblastus sanguinarius]
MASTDSTIPDTGTGDSIGSQGGQDVTDKIKSAVKGNIPTTNDVKPQDTNTKGMDDATTDTGKESASGLEQNTLL